MAEPWIWASMTGGPIMYTPSEDRIYSVLCPSWSCFSAGNLVDLVDGRIAHHSSPFDPDCSWSGCRVVPDPGLMEQLRQQQPAAKPAASE